MKLGAVVERKIHPHFPSQHSESFSDVSNDRAQWEEVLQPEVVLIIEDQKSKLWGSYSWSYAGAMMTAIIPFSFCC